MPFYMFYARYTPAAIRAMVETPQDREAATTRRFSAWRYQPLLLGNERHDPSGHIVRSAGRSAVG